MAYNDPSVDHLHAVQAESNEITNASLDATRRMLANAEETREVGAKTLAELDEQGDKLRKVNQDLTEINQDMKATERTLTQMEKCCGCCTCPCCASRSFESQGQYKDTWGEKGKDGEVISEQPGAQGGQSARYQGNRGGAKGGGGDYIKKVTNDAREEEMEENLGAVHDILGDLKAQARAMGTEIDDQNGMLEDIEDKTASNNDRVQAANTRAAKLLKNA